MHPTSERDVSEKVKADATEDICPLALAGIEVWPNFKAPQGDGHFLIGHIGEDVYLTVPEAKVPVIMEVLRLCDGKHTYAEIDRSLVETLKLKVPLEATIDLLARTGLLAHPRPEKLDRGEFRDFSTTLIKIPIQKLFDRLAPLTRVLAIPAGIGILCTIVAAAFSVFIYPGFQLEIIRDIRLASRLDSIIFMFLLIGPLSVLLHELGHTTAASFFRLKVCHAELSLYMKFMLLVIFKIKGIYTLKPYQRIIVWCAGLYVNLGIASACLLASLWLEPGGFLLSILYKTAWLNFLVILANISPFFPTDLYFVMSTLIKRVNMRTSAYLMLKNKFRTTGKKRDWVLAGYTIFALFSLAWAMLMTIFFLYGVLMNFGLNPVAAIIFLSLVAYLLFALRLKVFKKRIQRHVKLAESKA